jgi:hypothetical protein
LFALCALRAPPTLTLSSLNASSPSTLCPLNQTSQATPQIKLADKNKEIENLKSLMAVKNAQDNPTPSTSRQADMAALAAITLSRKRHSSQQLEKHAKGVKGNMVGLLSLQLALSTQVDPRSTI